MEYITDVERQFLASQEPLSLVHNELQQAFEIGHDVDALRRRAEGLRSSGEDDVQLMGIYTEIPLAPPTTWPYVEVSDLPGIQAELEPVSEERLATSEFLADKIRGAWFGRVVGNMLGKPVEFGFPRTVLRDYLETKGAYPLEDYVPIDLETAEADGFTMGSFVPYEALSRGMVNGGVRDDDVDYTILGLHLLETYGSNFSTLDIAREWLTRIPAYQTGTAERATYQNLIREVPLSETAEFHNPFREWIGALIRADIYGFTAPGAPRRAAELAYRDAVMSHRANGIYGAMWAAALVSTAFTAESPADSVRESLRHVPARSRLAEEIRVVLADHASGKTWEQAADELDSRHEGMSPVHTINNAGALVAAVLWGDGNFTRTIAYSVQAGLDTDSIGATAGSWAGAFGGYAGIPSHWLEPLHGRTVSAVFGFGEISLDDMATRTLRLVGELR